MEFDKFVDDIIKRQDKYIESKKINNSIVEADEARRKRAELYHERWQNRIVWEKSNEKQG